MTATVEQMSAASPDQLAGALSSDTLRLGYISASPVIGGQTVWLRDLGDGKPGVFKLTSESSQGTSEISVGKDCRIFCCLLFLFTFGLFC